jgi:hypothetical protein
MNAPRLFRLGVVTLGLALAAFARAAAPILDPAPEGSFTIVVIPDTQGYNGRATKREPSSTAPLTNPVFANHIRWIRENVASQRIVFVTHVGDIVDINNPDQWRLAQENLDGLRGVVPFGLAVGNHDMENKGSAALFSAHFPATRFRDYPWYGGTFTSADPAETALYGDNANSYQLFSAGGLKFVIIHLVCNAPDSVVAWASGIIERYRDRRAIISTHMDLGIRLKPVTEEGYVADEKGRMEWTKVHGKLGNSPLQLWEKLYRRHANLDFVFSGDQSRVTAYQMSLPAADGHTVHALMSDYMSAGPLRLYRFTPSENKVRVITYDTTKRELTARMPFVPDTTRHQFTIDYPMLSPAAR